MDEKYQEKQHRFMYMRKVIYQDLLQFIIKWWGFLPTKFLVPFSFFFFKSDTSLTRNRLVMFILFNAFTFMDTKTS